MTSSRHALSERGIVQLILVGAGALLLGWVFWTGYRIGLQTERADLIAGIWNHVGHGVVTAPLLVGYLWYRMVSKSVEKHYALSRAVFWTLCISIVFLIVSGPVVVWTYGSDLKVFGWFVMANPLGKLDAIHDPLEIAHKYVALALPVLVGLEIVLMFVLSRSVGAARS